MEVADTDFRCPRQLSKGGRDGKRPAQNEGHDGVLIVLLLDKTSRLKLDVPWEWKL
jgi:hypothetical protein